MFKHVVGKDHVDFCTGQQQDAAQFLQYLLEKIDRAELGSEERLRKKADANATLPTTSGLFSYKTTSRLVCAQDGKIKYNDNQPETVLSLRVPMEKGVIANKAAMSSDSEPEEKRLKAEEEVPTVTFQDCIDTWAAPHSIDGLRWSHLNNQISSATEETRFANFPRYVIAQIQRYELGPDWTPRKLEVNIDVPDEVDFGPLKSSGPQDGEDVVPDESEGEGSANGAEASQPQVNIDEGAVAQLMDMGFGMNGCMRALNAVGGSNVEMAMNWIFEHNSDPDFNDPLPESGAASSSSGLGDESGVDEAVVTSLVQNLGCFTSDQVRAALKESDGAADRAADWLFSHMDDLDGAIANLQSASSNASNLNEGTRSPGDSVPLEDGEGKYRLVGLVSHIGKNTGSGHYVAHLKKDDKWVIFNDEKVALSESPPTPHAYLYLFQRMDTIGAPNGNY
jgi:ubiquitin carboxyl-terminal hydrolase 5/13